MEIETMTPRETADYLRSLGVKTSPITVRKGIEQHVFPFGDYIEGESGPIYYVYKKLLNQWIEERAV